MRIVSLLPSATETLFELGLGEDVVAVSHACDHPSEARSRPRATRTRIDPGADGPAIDRQVRETLANEGTLYHVDEGVLHHVQPDLIVSQETCEVCAAGPRDVLAALARIEPVDRPDLVRLHAHTLDDVLDGIVTLGEAAGAAPVARELVADLRERVDAVRRIRADLPRPRVAVLDWLDPPMAAGHWVPELVEIAGGEPLLVAPGEPSRYVDWEELVGAAPEVLVLAPCGFDLPRVRDEARALADRPGWHDLPAVRAGRVHGADASSYFSRPGPRLVDSLEMLACALHPSAFASGYPRAAEAIPRLPT